MNDLQSSAACKVREREGAGSVIGRLLLRGKDFMGVRETDRQRERQNAE